MPPKVVPIDGEYTVYYCGDCQWYQLEPVKFAMADPRCKCGCSLRWINFSPSELSQAEAIMGFKLDELHA